LSFPVYAFLSLTNKPNARFPRISIQKLQRMKVPKNQQIESKLFNKFFVKNNQSCTVNGGLLKLFLSVAQYV